MKAAHTNLPGLPPPPDPPQHRYTQPLAPANAELLLLWQVLLVYARHLLGLLRQAGERGLALLARGFGSMQASFVLTNLTRGILRAIALERVLLARAAGTQAGGSQAGGQPDPAASNARKRTPRAPRQAATEA
ncbi:MAG TPA: hypothetical protein VFN42_03190, partial [Acetobacteraceae bacterium]|nr:hypothetical protein [Acetobacteraceae bacterium]